MNELLDITIRVRHIHALPDAEQAIAVRDYLIVMARLIAELKAQCDESIREWMKDHGVSEIVLGNMRYYPGTNPTTKGIDKTELTDIILELAEGDVGTLVDMMVSQPFKHGAVRAFLKKAGREDLYDSMFVTEDRPVLKDGKPTQTLRVINTDYVR